MNIRHVSFCLAALWVFMVGNGCGKSTAQPPAPPLPLSKDTVARIHWVGKKRLGVDATAYYLMRIWELPSSKQLENQTLNKLASAPAILPTQSANPNSQLNSMLLRQMLAAALQEECYFAIRQPTNKPPEMVFAIRLSATQDGYWKTNLGMLAQSLTGITALPMAGRLGGWTIKKHDAPNLVEALRDGDWSFVGMAQDRNTLLEETIARTRQYHDPFTFQSTNNWLEADIDWSRVSDALGLKWGFPAGSPIISLAITGDGGNVLTRANLTFPEPLRIAANSWNVPTNLIRGPLTSFTAMRGIEPAIVSSKLWADFSSFARRSNSPPNEFYFWSQSGAFQTSFAAPVQDAAGRVRELTDQLITKANPWLAAHRYVSFERMLDANGFTWGNVSTVKPFLTAKEIGGQSFIFGGLLANADFATNPPARSGLFGEFAAQTNLVYFDWELTGQRVEPWLFITQMTRSLLHRSQLAMDSAGANWLGNIKQRLGESKTEISQTAPNQLSFTRKSTIGLTAPELHLLVDWLESPQFPAANYSLSPASTP
jgi:hypothetical protein